VLLVHAQAGRAVFTVEETYNLMKIDRWFPVQINDVAIR